jgi:two-component system, NtrC family, nitrogen regulation sensor histidine kinase NtrY
MVPRPGWWLPAVALLSLAAGEWLRSQAPGLIPVAIIAALAVLLLAPWRQGPWPVLLSTWLALALALALSATAHRHQLLARGVAAETSRQADRVVAETRRRLDRLERHLAAVAERASALDLAPREGAFDAAEALVGSADIEDAVVILDSAGDPRLWAGVHRIPVRRSNRELGFRRTSFYAVLEARRQRTDGGMAIATALLWTDSVLVDPPASLAGGIEADLGAVIAFSAPGDSATAEWPAGAPIVGIAVPHPEPGEGVARLMERAGPVLAGLLVMLILSTAAGTQALPVRFLFLALLPWLALRAPLDKAFGLESIFSSSTFSSPLLGPLSSSSGALAVFGALVFVLAVAAWHRRTRRTAAGTMLAGLLLVAAPYLLREFGRGIIPPASGIPPWLWLTWHLTLLVVASAILTAVVALVRLPVAPRRQWPTLLGGVLATVAAVIGVLAYTGRPAWPTWYTAVWLPAIVLAARPASRRNTILAIGAVAGAGAALMTWGAGITGRTDIAVRDISALGSVQDRDLEPMLTGFAEQLQASPPGDAAELFRAWRLSALHRSGVPARLTLWTDARPTEDLVLNQLAVPDSVLESVAAALPPSGVPVVISLMVEPGIHHVAAARLDSSRTITIVVGPRSQLISPAPLGRLLEGGPERTPLYRLSLVPAGPGEPASRRPGWRREGWGLRSIRAVSLGGIPYEANVLIALGRPGSLFVRGSLILLLDIVLVWLMWLTAERISGVPLRRMDWQRLLGSYQARLAIALSVFFVTPAAVLAAISIRQLTAEAAQSRNLVLQRVLRDAIPPDLPVPVLTDDVLLAAQARRVDADLAVYSQAGALGAVSDPVLREVGVFPYLLDAAAFHSIYLDGDLNAAPRDGAGRARSSYALLPGGPGRAPAVLATIGPASDRALRERQLDVGFALVLVTLLGIMAAIVSARAAARALSRPVADLRDAALAFGMGLDVPGPRRQPPAEIAPVFEAFGRMAADVREGQAALEDARRRTEQVLATVSTGVVALDRDGQVLLANSQAEEVLGVGLARGTRFEDVIGPEWTSLLAAVTKVRAEQEEGGVELDVRGRRFAVRLAPLAPDPGSLVMAVTDVTEATQAARVLAWADIANQVAHAIKNPLTPLRLGVQHLGRVREQHPEQLAAALGETSTRILAEIDRLDAIARAFSRFGAPTDSMPPLERVDARAVLEEVVGLYGLAPEVTVRFEVADGDQVMARRDELVEVLLNLCDNARNAGARNVTMVLADNELEVRDDGRGIPREHLTRVFEPRFSTTSSGSGLGLAIVRRLVEGWGGEVTAESPGGPGAVFRIRFRVGG